MSDKGEELNKRVWKLFERAGFQTKPNSQDASEEAVPLLDGTRRSLDLSASVPELRVKIIGWNTTRSDNGRSFTVHVHDLQELKNLAGADSALFVLTEKEVTPERKTYVDTFGMRVWGEEELRYYEALADAIGDYARYEIISSFGIRTREDQPVHTVLALRVRQPRVDAGTSLFMFTMPAEKLLKTCCVLRKAQGSADAYQRVLDRHRLPKIAAFVGGADAILPTSIVLHLSDEVRWDPISKDQLFGEEGRRLHEARSGDYELGMLSIPIEYASMELIDGQHRLYAFTKAQAETREAFSMVVLGLQGLSPEKRRDTFVAINQNAVRANANLVAYLKYTEDEEICQGHNDLMAIKVVLGLSRTTPFKDRIRLSDLGSLGQVITLRGFSGYDLRGLLGKRGVLRKQYPSNTSADYVRSLRLYFSVLKKLFPEQWNDPKKYIVFTNRGISAFLKLLKSILRTCDCPLTKEIVEQYLQPLKDRKTDAGWETEKLTSAYVGAKGWKDFHRELVATIRQDHPGFKE